MTFGNGDGRVVGRRMFMNEPTCIEEEFGPLDEQKRCQRCEELILALKECATLFESMGQDVQAERIDILLK